MYVTEGQIKTTDDANAFIEAANDIDPRNAIRINQGIKNKALFVILVNSIVKRNNKAEKSDINNGIYIPEDTIHYVKGLETIVNNLDLIGKREEVVYEQMTHLFVTLVSILSSSLKFCADNLVISLGSDLRVTYDLVNAKCDDDYFITDIIDGFINVIKANNNASVMATEAIYIYWTLFVKLGLDVDELFHTYLRKYS